MNEVLKALDDQMLKWVSELDELHERRRDTDNAIQQLEENIVRARGLHEALEGE